MASFNYGKVFSEGRSVGDFGDSIDMGMKLGLNEHAKKYNELSRGLSSAKTENDIKNTYQYPLQEIGNKQDYLLIRVYERRPQNSSFSNELPGVVDAQLPGGETVKAIKMPGRITMMDDRFRIDSTPKNGVESNLTTLQKDMKHIYLPIPQSVSDSLAVSYAEDTLNPLQGLGLQLVEKGITDPGEVGSAAMELLKGAGALGSAIDSRVEKLVASALSGVALNQLGANVNPMTMITRSSGQILQSNLELLFSGVTLRSFPFTFDFVPRSKTEADEVKGIIRVLKRAVVPKNGRQAVFINAPSQFHFEYKSGMNTHPFLNKFKVGVLSTIMDLVHIPHTGMELLHIFR